MRAQRPEPGERGDHFVNLVVTVPDNLNKKQKDVVINALSRLKYVLPEDADYRSEVVRVLYIFEKLRAVKERRCF